MDPAYGGPPHGIRASIRAMAALGVENEVVCCDAPGADWIGRDAFPLHALGPGRFGFSYTPRLGPWLRKNVGRFDAVVVHGMWQWPGICAVRAVGSARKFDNGEDPPPATRHPLLFVMPHGMLDPWFQRDRSRRVKAVRNWFYWWLVERRVVNGAAGVLFTCEEELRLARTSFGGYRPKREVNVGYGIEEPPAFSERMRAAFLERVPGVGERKYFLFLGRINQKKGVDILVEAFLGGRDGRAVEGGVAVSAVRTQTLFSNSGTSWTEESVPHTGGTPVPPSFLCKYDSVGRDARPAGVDLVIAGPGWDSEYGKRIKELIREHGAGSMERGAIHSVGMLEGDAKWGAIYGCEAFILPSHQENFGIAVVEALGCGRPVLISEKVNIWREIAEDGAGLVEEDSVEGTARLLARIAAGELAGGDAGRFRECFQRRFGSQEAARRFFEAVGGEQKCRAGVPPAM
jgi:glycosyltransferase involved in cell wall biosynthesis